MRTAKIQEGDDQDTTIRFEEDGRVLTLRHGFYRRLSKDDHRMAEALVAAWREPGEETAHDRCDELARLVEQVREEMEGRLAEYWNLWRGEVLTLGAKVLDLKKTLGEHDTALRQLSERLATTDKVAGYQRERHDALRIALSERIAALEAAVLPGTPEEEEKFDAILKQVFRAFARNL